MTRLVWSPPAQQDIDELIAFYDQVGSGVADRLLDRIDEAADKLRDNPRLGPTLPDSERRSWRAGRPPYVLIYRHVGDVVRILRVRHERENWRPPA